MKKSAFRRCDSAGATVEPPPEQLRIDSAISPTPPFQLISVSRTKTSILLSKSVPKKHRVSISKIRDANTKKLEAAIIPQLENELTINKLRQSRKRSTCGLAGTNVVPPSKQLKIDSTLSFRTVPTLPVQSTSGSCIVRNIEKKLDAFRYTGSGYVGSTGPAGKNPIT